MLCICFSGQWHIIYVLGLNISMQNASPSVQATNFTFNKIISAVLDDDDDDDLVFYVPFNII